MNGMIFGQGGFSLEGKTNFEVSGVCSVAGPYVDVLNISGSGVLTSLFAIGSNDANIVFEVDGVSGTIMYMPARGTQSLLTLCPFIKFNSSLKIKATCWFGSQFVRVNSTVLLD